MKRFVLFICVLLTASCVSAVCDIEDDRVKAVCTQDLRVNEGALHGLRSFSNTADFGFVSKNPRTIQAKGRNYVVFAEQIYDSSVSLDINGEKVTLSVHEVKEFGDEEFVQLVNLDTFPFINIMGRVDRNLNPDRLLGSNTYTYAFEFDIYDFKRYMLNNRPYDIQVLDIKDNKAKFKINGEITRSAGDYEFIILKDGARLVINKARSAVREKSRSFVQFLIINPSANVTVKKSVNIAVPVSAKAEPSDDLIRSFQSLYPSVVSWIFT